MGWCGCPDCLGMFLTTSGLFEETTLGMFLAFLVSTPRRKPPPTPTTSFLKGVDFLSKVYSFPVLLQLLFFLIYQAGARFLVTLNPGVFDVTTQGTERVPFSFV